MIRLLQGTVGIFPGMDAGDAVVDFNQNDMSFNGPEERNAADTLPRVGMI